MDSTDLLEKQATTHAKQVVTRGRSRAGIQKYPKRMRRRCAVLHLELASVHRVSEITGVNAQTICNWMQTQEWKEAQQDALAEIDAENKQMLREVIRKGYAETIDRLDGGDVVFHPKTGELSRLPMKGRDTALIASLALDKLRIAEGKPTQITATTDALARAAEAFNKLADTYRK